MMSIAATLVTLLFCHLVGDYILQTSFIAGTKGSNWYHLFVHCTLYCLPFLAMFGYSWGIMLLFVAHMIIDTLKARYTKISYPEDQIIHYLTILVYMYFWVI